MLTKVQKDAEACGIEIPPIFSNIDEELGMPKLLFEEVNEATLTATLKEAIQQHLDDEKLSAPIQSPTDLPLPKTVFYDMAVQTCLLSL